MNADLHPMLGDWVLYALHPEVSAWVGRIRLFYVHQAYRNDWTRSSIDALREMRERSVSRLEMAARAAILDAALTHDQLATLLCHEHQEVREWAACRLHTLPLVAGEGA